MCTFALIVYYCIARLNQSLVQFIQRFHSPLILLLLYGSLNLCSVNLSLRLLQSHSSGEKKLSFVLQQVDCVESKMQYCTDLVKDKI